MFARAIDRMKPIRSGKDGSSRIRVLGRPRRPEGFPVVQETVLGTAKSDLHTNHPQSRIDVLHAASATRPTAPERDESPSHMLFQSRADRLGRVLAAGVNEDWDLGDR